MKKVLEYEDLPNRELARIKRRERKRVTKMVINGRGIIRQQLDLRQRRKKKGFVVEK